MRTVDLHTRLADLEAQLARAEQIRVTSGSRPELDRYLGVLSARIERMRREMAESGQIGRAGVRSSPGRGVGREFTLQQLVPVKRAPARADLDPFEAVARWARATAADWLRRGPRSERTRKNPVRTRFPFEAGRLPAIRETAVIAGRAVPLFRPAGEKVTREIDELIRALSELTPDKRRKVQQIVVEPAGRSAGRIEPLAGGVLRVRPGTRLAQAIASVERVVERMPELERLEEANLEREEQAGFARLGDFLTGGEKVSKWKHVPRGRDARLVPAKSADLQRARKKTLGEHAQRIGMSAASLVHVTAPVLQQVSVLVQRPAPPPEPQVAPVEAPLVTIAGPLASMDPIADLESRRQAVIDGLPAAPAPTEEYAVGEGETPETIARARYGDESFAAHIREINGDVELSAGMIIRVPVPTEMQAAIAAGQPYSSTLADGTSLHEVQEGERLLEIAHRWRERRFPSLPLMQVVELIAEANRLDRLDAQLVAGTALRIPSPAVAEEFVAHQNPLSRPTTGAFVIWMRGGLTAEAIGQRYGVDPERVRSANPELDSLEPNAPILVPALRERTGSFRVRLEEGATIPHVAARYGVPIEALLQANPEIASADQRVSELQVPGVAGDVRSNAAYAIRYFGRVENPERALEELAKAHQVGYEALLAANDGLTPETFARVLRSERYMDLRIPERGWHERAVPHQIEAREGEKPEQVARRFLARLDQIAADHGVTVDEILAATFNEKVTRQVVEQFPIDIAKITDRVRVRVPAEPQPKIEAGAALEAMPLHPETPTVRLGEGETLAAVSTRLGISIEAILALNGYDRALSVPGEAELRIPEWNEKTAVYFKPEQVVELHRRAEEVIDRALGEKHWASAVLTLRGYMDLVEGLIASPATDVATEELLRSSVHNLDQKIVAGMLGAGVFFLDAWTPPDRSAAKPNGRPISLDPWTVRRWAGDGSVSSVAAVLSSGLYPGVGFSVDQLLTLNRIRDPSRVPAMVYLKVPAMHYEPQLRSLEVTP